MTNPERWWLGAAIALLLIGLASRLAPLVAGGDWLFQCFMTEDGYLMLTVARNIALGKGMTIADGTIATNGVQPLVTYLYALCFWLADGQRETGIVYVHVLSIAIALGTAWLIARLARRIIPEQGTALATGLLAAGIWFAAPLVLSSSMNGLETGLYLFAVALVGNLLVRWAREPGVRWPFGRSLAAGILFGTVFWVRNDAVFLVAAFCAVWLFTGVTEKGPGIQQRVKEVLIVGFTALVIATPWLINNYTRFGSIVPISGKSEAFGVGFAQHVHLVPVKLAEHMLFLLPVPESLETVGLVQLGAVVVVLAGLVAAVAIYRASGYSVRVLVLTMGLFVLALGSYYGLFFGAPYFMSRYFVPPTPIIAVGAAAILMEIGRRLSRRGWPVMVPVVSAGLVLLALGLNLRPYVEGREQGHFQVVEWVEANVDEGVWIGAIQTGTLGFFHDRTINLDGKVNPHALEARMRGEVLSYVVDSDMQYLVDWVGITSWAQREQAQFGEHFEVLVEDHRRNLGVLRRVRKDDQSG